MNNDTDLDKPRTAYEIARRVIVLHCVIAAAHGVRKDDITEWLNEEQLWNELTPRELVFMVQDEHLRKEAIWMTWLVEAQVSLLWAIEKLNELPPPTQPCPSGLIIAVMPGLFEVTSPFINSAMLRSAEEIEREEANIYDIHCRVRQAVRKNEAIPEGYNKEVVFFRHYGLSWVRGYGGQAWDEVTPDA